MAKTVADAFNDNQIAKGYNNFTGLTNIELILVDRKYFPRVHDFPLWDDGQDRVQGNGIAATDGFDSTQWIANGITFAQWWYLYTTILGGNRSGKVTIKTRRWAIPMNTTMGERYIIANAILTLPKPVDIAREPLGYPQFVFEFTRIDTNSLLHEDQMKGTLSVTGASTAQENIDTTPEKLAAFTTSGLNAGVTTSASDDSHTIIVAANYKSTAVIDFTSTASTVWTFQFYVDGAAVGVKFLGTTNATPDAVQVVMEWPQAHTATDVVTIYVNSDDGGGTADITVTEAVFSVASF